MQKFDEFGYDQFESPLPRAHAGTTLPVPSPTITSSTLQTEQSLTFQDSNRYVNNHSKETVPSGDPLSLILSESVARSKAVKAMSKKLVEDRMVVFSSQSKGQQLHTLESPPPPYTPQVPNADPTASRLHHTITSNPTPTYFQLPPRSQPVQLPSRNRAPTEPFRFRSHQPLTTNSPQTYSLPVSEIDYQDDGIRDDRPQMFTNPSSQHAWAGLNTQQFVEGQQPPHVGLRHESLYPDPPNRQSLTPNAPTTQSRDPRHELAPETLQSTSADSEFQKRLVTPETRMADQLAWIKSRESLIFPATAPVSQFQATINPALQQGNLASSHHASFSGGAPERHYTRGTGKNLFYPLPETVLGVLSPTQQGLDFTMEPKRNRMQSQISYAGRNTHQFGEGQHKSRYSDQPAIQPTSIEYQDDVVIHNSSRISANPSSQHAWAGLNTQQLVEGQQPPHVGLRRNPRYAKSSTRPVGTQRSHADQDDPEMPGLAYDGTSGSEHEDDVWGIRGKLKALYKSLERNSQNSWANTDVQEATSAQGPQATYFDGDSRHILRSVKSQGQQAPHNPNEFNGRPTYRQREEQAVTIPFPQQVIRANPPRRSVVFDQGGLPADLPDLVPDGSSDSDQELFNSHQPQSNLRTRRTTSSRGTTNVRSYQPQQHSEPPFGLSQSVSTGIERRRVPEGFENSLRGGPEANGAQRHPNPPELPRLPHGNQEDQGVPRGMVQNESKYSADTDRQEHFGPSEHMRFGAMAQNRFSHQNPTLRPRNPGSQNVSVDQTEPPPSSAGNVLQASPMVLNLASQGGSLLQPTSQASVVNSTPLGGPLQQPSTQATSLTGMTTLPPLTGQMRSVPHNAFLKFSGELVCCFDEMTDGSQNLVDWMSAFTNAYRIANIPENRWNDFLQAHLTGAAAQEARTLRRDDPSITWKGIVDAFAVKFTVVDEQTQLRAKVSALRPSQFKTLNKFLAKFKHLVSYVDKAIFPPQLQADLLVQAMTGTSAALHLTQLHISLNGKPSLPAILNLLEVLSRQPEEAVKPDQAVKSVGAAVLPPHTNVLLAGYANQPVPAVVPSSPTKRSFDRVEEKCRFCSNYHWSRLCPSEAGIAARLARPPLRPCRYCGENH